VELGYTDPLTNVVRAAAEAGVVAVDTSTVAVVDQAIAGLVATSDSPTTALAEYSTSKVNAYAAAGWILGAGCAIPA
jgi:hypothetical protein